MFGGPEIALWVLLLVASATDLLWGKIYNWLTFTFLLSGLIYRFAFNGADSGIQALIAVAVAFGLFIPLYAVKAVAAGDAKLLMAMGAWTDSKTILQVAGISIVVGALVGLVALIRTKGIGGGAKSIAENVRQGEPTPNAIKMPFGPAFFCAYLIVSVAQARHWEIL